MCKQSGEFDFGNWPQKRQKAKRWTASTFIRWRRKQGLQFLPLLSTHACWNKPVNFSELLTSQRRKLQSQLRCKMSNMDGGPLRSLEAGNLPAEQELWSMLCTENVSRMQCQNNNQVS